MSAERINSFQEIYHIIMDQIGHSNNEKTIKECESLLLHIARQDGKQEELDRLMHEELGIA